MLGLGTGAGALFWGGERWLGWVWLKKAGRWEAVLVAIDMFGAGWGLQGYMYVEVKPSSLLAIYDVHIHGILP